MSRTQEWPVLWMCGMQMCIAALGCAAFTGCGSAPSNQVTANQFRPAQEEQKKKTDKEEGEKKADPAVSNEKNQTVAAPPKAPKHLDAAENGSETAPPNAPAGKEPTGPYAAKLKEMRQLANVKPRGDTREQQMAHLLKTMQARLAIAEELAADPAVPEEVRNEALVTRVDCYALLISADEPEAREAFAQAALDLSQVKDPKLAVLGKVQLFSLKMMDMFALQPRDGKQALESIANLLEQTGQDEVGFEATVRVVNVMQQLKLTEDVAKALDIIGNHFASNPNPKIAMQAQGLQVNKLLMQISLNPANANAEQKKALLAKMEQLITTSKSNPGVFKLLSNAGRILEGIGDGSSAIPFYELAQKTYGKHANEEVARETNSSVENAFKRIALVGTEFQVAGVLSDGSPFDWSKYKGKIVLVDFWATWCGPCLEEMSNIAKNYELYHAQGFEVVGVNLDESPEDLQSFLEKQSLAWSTVVSSNPAELGFKNPLAVKCGIDAIPFVVLIGRDGKVAGIHVRGERLEEKLAEFFGAKKPAAKEAVSPAGENPLRKEESGAEKKPE